MEVKRFGIYYHNTIILGEPADKFYLILNGKVCIFCDKTHHELEVDNYWKLKSDSYAKYVEIFERIKNNQFEEIKEFKFENLKSKYSAQSVINLHNDITDQKIIDSFFQNKGLFSVVTGIDLSFEEKLLFLNQERDGQYFFQGVPIFKDINIIGNGLTFGELGLIFHKPRTGTVISSEESYILSLSKDHYYEIFHTQIQDILIKVACINQIFIGLSHITIAKLSYRAEENFFSLNEKIYEEGDAASSFYFIRSGEVLVLNLFLALIIFSKLFKKSYPHTTNNIKPFQNDKNLCLTSQSKKEKGINNIKV